MVVLQPSALRLCMYDAAAKSIYWSQTNYFTYVVSGKMTLKTPDADYEIRAGQSYFVKKGAFLDWFPFF